MTTIKHLQANKILSLKHEVAIEKNQVVYNPLSVSDTLGLYLVGLDRGQTISTTGSKGDALITVLDGRAKVLVGGQLADLEAQESMVLPAHVAHSVEALDSMKMQLTLVFPDAAYEATSNLTVDESIPTNVVEPTAVVLGQDAEDYIDRLSQDSRQMIQDGRF